MTVDRQMIESFLSRTFFSVCVTLLLSACANSVGPQMTPLEIQSMQTRDFENRKEVVFASVMSVFQDLGYTIKTADLETGLITAQSAAQSTGMSKIFLGYTKVTQTSANAFIERIGSKTRVRLNFVEGEKSSMIYGQTDEEETPILDAQVYQNAFEKIDNAIFVRSSQ